MKEREFSHKLRKALRAEGFSVRPIETGGTTVGFPDLFVVGLGAATFIEVKSRPGMAVKEVVDDIDSLLGPGQKQFAREFAVGTTPRYGEGRHCVVFVYCSDGILVLRVDREGELLMVTACKHEDEPLSRPDWAGAALIAGYLGETMSAGAVNYNKGKPNSVPKEFRDWLPNSFEEDTNE